MLQLLREIIVDILLEFALRVPGYWLARVFTRNVELDDFLCIFLSALIWASVLLVAVQFGM